MPLLLSVDEVVRRLLTFPSDTYLYVGSFMRSVALAAGALVLLQILSCRKYLWRLLPWVASLLATILTLATWGRGVLLTTSRANIWDSILPLLMGIAEFCLFAILSPSEYWRATAPDLAPAEGQSLAGVWRYWFFVHAVHAFLAIFLVWNRIDQTSPAADFKSALRPLALEYMGWLRADRIGAVRGVITFLLLGSLTLCLATWEKKLTEKKLTTRKRYAPIAIATALALFPILIYWGLIRQADAQRQRVDDFVSVVALSQEKKAINPGASSNAP
jgi:hypothetical protein